jgi:hypothetical protein
MTLRTLTNAERKEPQTAPDSGQSARMMLPDLFGHKNAKTAENAETVKK